MQTGARSIRVVAIRSFAYNGRLIHTGEAVDMPPFDVAIHTQQRHLSSDPQHRPTYQTRELVAEPTPPVPVVLVMESLPEPEPVPDPPKRRRGRPRKQPLA